MDALPSPAATEFAATCVRVAPTGKAMADAVEAVCRRIRVVGPDGQSIKPALYQLREDKQAFYLFVCNTGYVPDSWVIYQQPDIRHRRLEFPDVRIAGLAACRGEPVELDPVTGNSFRARASRTADGWEIRTSLPRLGSRLFMFPKNKTSPSLPRLPDWREVKGTELSGDWEFQLSESNVLLLDRPQYRIASGRWQGPTEILRVDNAIREAVGLPLRGGEMVQPWDAAAFDEP